MRKLMQTRALIIRRSGTTTLRIAIPREFVLRRELDEGDHVMWVEDEDGVRLKFIRLAELDELAKSAA